MLPADCTTTSKKKDREFLGHLLWRCVCGKTKAELQRKRPGRASRPRSGLVSTFQWRRKRRSLLERAPALASGVERLLRCGTLLQGLGLPFGSSDASTGNDILLSRNKMHHQIHSLTKPKANTFSNISEENQTGSQHVTSKVTLSIKYAAAENLLTTNVFHIIRARPGERVRGASAEGSPVRHTPRTAVLPERVKPRGLFTCRPRGLFTCRASRVILMKQKPVFFNRNQHEAAQEDVRTATGHKQRFTSLGARG